MAAGALQGDFQLGDWLVEPRQQRASGRGTVVTLSDVQLRLLLCLAERHGEAVDRNTLSGAAWPGDPAGEQKLRDAIVDLRKVLGDAPHRPRYIVSLGTEGYALIAHVEARPGPSGTFDGSVAAPVDPNRRPRIGRLQGWIVELRRRQVFKVTASYLVVMWLVLQVAEVTFAPLRLPDWWITALTILAVIGLPIVVVLAWAYEITPAGIRFDASQEDHPGAMPRARRAVVPAVVAGVAAMAAVTGVAWWRTLQPPTEAAQPALDAGVPSIAVLAFVDMSPTGGDRYLGDGLAEELSTRLAQIPGLRVAARTSAFEFRGRSLDVRRIGHSLGVRHVLEGSVRREGDSLRVTAQLVDARTGYHVWAGSYDRGWHDVLAMQDDIATSVTDALKIVLSPESRRQQGRYAGLDDRAIEPYLTGLALLRQSGDMTHMLDAAGNFRDAIAIDPAYAPAHAALCEVDVRKHERTRDPHDLEAAEKECTRALDLDASSLETQKALAALYVSSGDFPRAEAIYRRLIERHPTDADGHIGLGRALEGEGRALEAESAYRRAITVEPAFWRAYNDLGVFLFGQGRIDAAVAAYRRVTELTPSSATGFNNLGAALEMQGNLADSAAAFQASLRIEPSRSAYSNLGTVFYHQGRFDQAVANYDAATRLAAEDHMVWGNLADAEWQLAGRRTAALANYQHAIGLAERDRLTASSDPALLAQLAHYYGRTGDFQRAGECLGQARRQAGDDLYVEYAAAVLAADRGDRAAALVALQKSVGLGYPRRLVKVAPDFVLLHGTPGFRRLVDDRPAGSAGVHGAANGNT
jgi:TolB-like protein/tetratricopeptide (TPR) repeat protein/DNA-binding winged helix-turn-helix (wHTH) protein